MGKLIFITGGCRSGKSTLALELAKKSKGPTAFVATAVAIDEEMTERIRKHTGERPKHWKTFEEPYALSARLEAIGNSHPTVIIDCVTVYLGNLLHRKLTTARIQEEIERILRAMKKSRGRFVVVSNEVGLGIVPATGLGRKFRDIAGWANKTFASNADRVYFMISGIAQKIKG